MEIEILEMTKETLPGVAKIEAECFLDAWDEIALANTLSNDSIRYFIACKDGSVLGYIGFYDLIDELSIINIAVTEKSRRTGIAKSLLSALNEYFINSKANRITLEVRASNVCAISLYRSFGFSCVGEKDNYYTKPKEKAYFYQLEKNDADTEL